MTKKYDTSQPRHIKHNTYTQMNLQSNILSGSFALAVEKDQNKRLPKSFYMSDPKEYMAANTGQFDYYKLEQLEQELLRKAEESGAPVKSQAARTSKLTSNPSQVSLSRKHSRASSAKFRITKQQQPTIQKR